MHRSENYGSHFHTQIRVKTRQYVLILDSRKEYEKTRVCWEDLKNNVAYDNIKALK